jgi:large subunit ribosomal protein L10
VDGQTVSVKDIDALAALPSKEEIYAKLLRVMNAPGTQLAQVLNAVGRNVAVVIGQGVEKGKFKEA